MPTELLEHLPVSLEHTGPAVDPRETGPARFVAPLLARFDREAAMELARFFDGFYREPASDGYEAVVDRLLGNLYAAGFGAAEGFELDVVKSGLPHPSWTPRSAVLEITRVDNEGRPVQFLPLLTTDGQAGPNRVMLPANAPGCDVIGDVAHGLSALTEPGMILLTDKRIRSVEAEAREKGAIGVLSSYLLPYCNDPTGEDRQNLAIFSDAVPLPPEMIAPA